MFLCQSFICKLTKLPQYNSLMSLHPLSMATSAARMSSKHRTCQGCGKAQDDTAAPFKTCAACRRSRYCSEICQRADWANHKTICLQLRATKAAQCEFDKWVEAGNRLIADSLVRSGGSRRSSCLRLALCTRDGQSRPEPGPRRLSRRPTQHGIYI